MNGLQRNSILSPSRKYLTVNTYLINEGRRCGWVIPLLTAFLKSGVIEIIFYDFEVFKEDWLAVFIDVTCRKEYVIVNDLDKLKALYEANIKDIWVGFNNRHYDQYITKGILLGMNPKRINDWIIKCFTSLQHLL